MHIVLICADKKQMGKIIFSDFVQEYVRLQFFRVLRSIQSEKQEYDDAADAEVSVSELLFLLSEQLGEHYAKLEINACISSIDTNGAGKSFTINNLIIYYLHKEQTVKEQRIKNYIATYPDFASKPPQSAMSVMT
jgi:Ca2+-binding EF-hand superfamily protein